LVEVAVHDKAGARHADMLPAALTPRG
jgi:hypothetical protein